MEKMNEVAEFLERNPGLADCVVQITYSEMHDIAEAFRELERRAEAAEAKLAEHEENSMFGHLEKCSEIVARWPEWKRNGADAIKFIEGLDEFEVGYLNGHSEACKNRPAPAINLAELVPC